MEKVILKNILKIKIFQKIVFILVLERIFLPLIKYAKVVTVPSLIETSPQF